MNQESSIKKLKKWLAKYVGTDYRKIKTIFKTWKFRWNLYKLKKKNPKIKTSIKQNKKLEFNDITKIQNKIDSLSYPPTHHYQLDSLRPKGVLKQRVEQFEAVSSNFFYGNKFLDVGCNKGFFSLLSSKSSIKVHSIDPDPEFIELCNQLIQKNMTVEHTSFKNYIPEEEFDRILFGNVHHYLFKECEGWEWVYKLATIATDQVIIEGPIDMNCVDMQEVLPENLRNEFTFEKFLKIMEKFFTLEIKIDSILVQRYVMLFKRKHDDFDEEIELSKLPLIKPIKDDKFSMTFQTRWKNRKVIAKINKFPRKADKNRINIARLSPISNNAIGSIIKNDEFIGWIEEFRNDEVFRYKENQKEILNLLCDHNIFLSKLGYIDTDWATINFFKKDNILFDKGAVFPIKKINKEVFGDLTENKKGYFFLQLENSFDIITEEMEMVLYTALKSKNSDTIEQALKEIKKLI